MLSPPLLSSVRHSSALVWQQPPAHSCFEKLKDSKGDLFCSGSCSLPLLPDATKAAWRSTIAGCSPNLLISQHISIKNKVSFRLDTSTTTHTHIFQSTHNRPSVSTAANLHYHPTQPPGKAGLPSFLWLFCSDIAGTGQICIPEPLHTNPNQKQKAFSAKPSSPDDQLRGCTGRRAGLCHHLSEDLGYATVSRSKRNDNADIHWPL